MKNLLVITQKVDEEDDLLGFFVSWIREFASNFDKVYIITLGKGKYNLPENVFVYSLGKERNSSRIARFFNFYKFLFRLMPKVGGVFAHMSPIFALASWPVASIFRKKIILWYLHRSKTFKLWLAGKLCFKIATASKDSLNLKSEKIVEVGHGIPIPQFPARNLSSESSLNILSVGRLSRIKNFETLIRAGAILKEKRINFSINIAGQPILLPDFAYERELKLLVERLSLQADIGFSGFMPHNKIEDLYRKNEFVVNCAPTGGLDKVVFEAIIFGCIPLTSNLVFKNFFSVYAKNLLYSGNNPEDLAEKIHKLFSMEVKKKEEIFDYLFERVSKDHDLVRTVEKISRLY